MYFGFLVQPCNIYVCKKRITIVNQTCQTAKMPNTKMVQVYYHLRLITADPDDDKFVDCAFKANARYIVTEDHHYDILKQTPLPYIDVVGIDEFIKVLRG